MGGIVSYLFHYGIYLVIRNATHLNLINIIQCKRWIAELAIYADIYPCLVTHNDSPLHIKRIKPFVFDCNADIIVACTKFTLWTVDNRHLSKL